MGNLAQAKFHVDSWRISECYRMNLHVRFDSGQGKFQPARQVRTVALAAQEVEQDFVLYWGVKLEQSALIQLVNYRLVLSVCQNWTRSHARFTWSTCTKQTFFETVLM